MPAKINTTTTVIDVEERVGVRPFRIKLNGTGSRGGGNGGRKGGNNGGGNNNNGGQDDQRTRFSPARYWICLIAGLAAIVMTFAVLIIAYVARAGVSQNWQPIELPSLLWLSTVLIIGSSAMFEAARRSQQREESSSYRRWLMLTLLFGLGFLVSQLIVFRQLVAQGVYLSTNPHSAFFYILTGTHGVHLLGGVIALTYLLMKAQRRAAQLTDSDERETQLKQRTLSSVIGLYWHFIDGLWVVLFAVLSLWK